MSEKNDPIRPNHYKITIRGVDFECLDVLYALGFDKSFSLGNALKYLWRAGRKTPDALEDLKKARFYIDQEISRRESGH